MARALNQEIVNDAAKLMMHRLIARRLARDPALVDRARAAHARVSARYAGQPFVRDWDRLLCRPPSELRLLLASRDREMNRLRLSSPFVIADGVDFTDLALRQRIWRAAKRLAMRAATHHSIQSPT